MADTKITSSEVAMWRAVGVYTAAQAAWLLIDREPQTMWIRDTEGMAFTLACRIQERFRTSDYGEFGPRNGFPSDVAPLVSQIVDPGRLHVTLDELRLFAEECGMRPTILCDDEPEQMQGWPYTHDTKLLKAARWVIETYSGQPDWPTRELVIEKLQEHHGLSRNEARAVDTVTRPDSIRGR